MTRLPTFRRSTLRRALLAAAIGPLLASTALAAVIVVDGLGDENASSQPNGICTLREAVLAANGDAAVDGCVAGSPGQDTIVLPAGTISLTLAGNDDLGAVGDLDVRGDLILVGTGEAASIIEAPVDRALHVLAPAFLVLSDLTVRGAVAEGLRNDGATVAATRVTIEDAAGPGIRNLGPGQVALDGCTVRGNAGGGIDATTTSSGAPVVFVTSSTIEDNQAELGGGIRSYQGAVTVTSSTIRGNVADERGGGIYAVGDLSVIDSLVAGNVAGTQGGGVWATCAQIVSCVSSVTMAGTTLTANAAPLGAGFMNVGGVFGSTVATVTNSTVSGNLGDGLWNEGAELDLVHATVAENAGAALVTGFLPGLVTVANSLLDGCAIGAAPPVILSHGGNVEAPGDTCRLDDPSDLVAVPSLGLEPLADHGGPTPTHALSPLSPALGAARVERCPAVDQRGVARPAPTGGDCDAGAFEQTGCGARLALLPALPFLTLLGRRRHPVARRR